MHIAFAYSEIEISNEDKSDESGNENDNDQNNENMDNSDGKTFNNVDTEVGDSKYEEIEIK